MSYLDLDPDSQGYFEMSNYDFMDESDDYSYSPPHQRKTKTCGRCGYRNLHWKQVDGKWYLYNSKEKQHICPLKDLP